MRDPLTDFSRSGADWPLLYFKFERHQTHKLHDENLQPPLELRSLICEFTARYLARASFQRVVEIFYRSQWVITRQGQAFLPEVNGWVGIRET